MRDETQDVTLEDFIRRCRQEEQNKTAEIDAEMLKAHPEEETFWQSLSKDDQLKAFCCIIRRICKGELQDEYTYRSMLYKVFGFGPQAYTPAYLAGYMELHNILVEHRKDYPPI